MIDTLLFPFQFAFMNNAFLMMAIIAVPTSLLSCFLVLKGWSLMGDAISHAVLPGIVVAYVLGIPLLVGAFVAGMVCALATGFLAGNSRVKQDTVMGVVFSGMFGFGLVLHSKIPTDMDLHHILFGNMLGVGSADLWTAGTIAALVGAIIIAKRREFMLHTFDPVQAQAVGLQVGWLHYGMLAMISALYSSPMPRKNSNCSSVSPGKPTIKVVRSTASGSWSRIWSSRRSFTSACQGRFIARSTSGWLCCKGRSR